MKILGIETSCDETAVCVIEASGDLPSRQTGMGADFKFEVLGNALYSQVAIHAPYGGVFPNLAKREHAKNLIPLLKQALMPLYPPSGGRSSVKQGFSDHQGPSSGAVSGDNAKIRELLEREPDLYEQLVEFLNDYDKPDINAIAVTCGPGLEPALWVGVNLARALSILWNIPLVAIDHMEGHIMMSAMQEGALADFQFPLLSLLISGGHTELVLSRQWMQYEVINQTRDDAVGEAFDKVARMIGLPYPGGPEISRLAAEARHLNPESAFKFTPPMLHSKDFDFSFSGLKTEVRKFVEAQPRGSTSMARSNLAKDIARAFE